MTQVFELGEQVAKDMIAVRIGPDMRMAVVAAPSYFAKHSRPKRPQDLTDYTCINLRLPTYVSVYAWEFEKNGREVKVQVEGQLTFNNLALRLKAALADAVWRICPRIRCGHTFRKAGSYVRLRGLVPEVFGLPPLLSEQATDYPGFPRACGCAALPTIIRYEISVCYAARSKP